MSDIKDALAAKKKKLEELRRKREERQRKKQAAESSAAEPPAAAASAAPAPAPAPAPRAAPAPAASSASDLLAQVSQLVGTAPAAAPAAAAGAAGAPAAGRASAAARAPVQLEVSEATMDIPPVNRTTYEKSVQAGEDDPVALTRAVEAELAEEEKEAARREEEERRRREEEEMETAERQRREREEEERKRRVLTPNQKKAIVESPEFVDFFSRGSKMLERALAQNAEYDVTIDYTVRTDDQKEAATVLRQRCAFRDDKLTFGRPVTSIDWSPQHGELLLASYAADADSVMSLNPDGLVLVWNTHLPTRPEYKFTCQSAVLTAQFHPSDPRLVIGGTMSGQVVIWDSRAKQTPVDRTSLSHGHTHPLYGLTTVPAVNRLHSVVTCSTDGRLCVWNDDDLVEPTLTLDLEYKKHELATTCLAFPQRDTNNVAIGSDEGFLYRASLYDQHGGAAAGGAPADDERKAQPRVIRDAIRAHAAPITQVHFHPPQRTGGGRGVPDKDIGGLHLTSSYDWTVKLWSTALPRPLFTFNGARDYVYDAQWSPTHPALFVSGDGAGALEFWDLNRDTEMPVHRCHGVGKRPAVDGASAADEEKDEDRAVVSRLKWNDDGKHLAVGSSNGTLLVHEVAPEVSQAPDDAAGTFYGRVMKAMDVARSAGNADAE